MSNIHRTSRTPGTPMTPTAFHGKEGVAGSSPAEGSAESSARSGKPSRSADRHPPGEPVRGQRGPNRRAQRATPAPESFTDVRYHKHQEDEIVAHRRVERSARSAEVVVPVSNRAVHVQLVRPPGELLGRALLRRRGSLVVVAVDLSVGEVQGRQRHARVVPAHGPAIPLSCAPCRPAALSGS